MKLMGIHTEWKDFFCLSYSPFFSYAKNIQKLFFTRKKRQNVFCGTASFVTKSDDRRIRINASNLTPFSLLGVLKGADAIMDPMHL